MPERTEELAALWWQEAERYGVLPLDDRMQTRMSAQDPSEDRTALRDAGPEPDSSTRSRDQLLGARVPDPAHVEPWRAGHDGVLLAWGRRATGMTLFVRDERLVFDLNLGGGTR